MAPLGLLRAGGKKIIDGSLSDDAIGDMIEDSYDLVVSKLPKTRRRPLGWRGDPC
jgi:predicted DNA-binding protein (MmcQ/YjbR family)